MHGALRRTPSAGNAERAQVKRPGRRAFTVVVCTSLLVVDADVALRRGPVAAADAATNPGATIVAADGPHASPPHRWAPQLHAVVVAGLASAVSVDGTLVPLGGEVEGYRLEGVGPTRARFRRGLEVVELRLTAAPDFGL